VAIEVTLPTLLAQMGIGEFNKASLGVTENTPNSSSNHYDALDRAAERRVKEIAPNASEMIIGRKENVPDGINDFNSNKGASHQRRTLKDGRKASLININPNADSSYYAHELGHGISQKTVPGKFINQARHFNRINPKLAKALYYALPAGLAGTGAALQEGDDDLIASLAVAAAAASPTLIDEALATKNAFAIMKDAGIQASMGQRGRLAAGYLSYLAPVIIGASVANAVGNRADDYTALYDL